MLTFFCLNNCYLAFYDYILLIIYLGVNVPFADIQPVIDVYQPDYIFSVLTSSMNMKQTIQAFTITAKNNSSVNATGVIVTDILQSGYTYVSSCYIFLVILLDILLEF